jgi:hypothetical protein
MQKSNFQNYIFEWNSYSTNGEEALQYLNSIKPKDNDSNSKNNLTNFFRFKHACNGGLKFLDCFSSIDYSDFNTTTNNSFFHNRSRRFRKRINTLWSSIFYQNPLHHDADYLLNKLNKEDRIKFKCCGKYKKAMFVFQNYMKIHDSPVKLLKLLLP